jgi:Tol biopolymer transport system component
MSTLKMIFGRLPAIFYILAVVLMACSPARATYPGKNGRIAFVGNFSGTWQLYTINPDGSDLLQVTSLPATELQAQDWSPNYSPDGQQIVFSHDMTGAAELYVINVDGTGLTQITHDGGEDLFPQWSPDGTRILFSLQYIGDRFDYHHLATIRPDGTDREVLTHNLFDDFQAKYTVDGKHIVFTSTRVNLISALWIMNADGSYKKRLTEPALEGGGPDVSPNGRDMVFFNQAGTERPSSLIVSDILGNHRKKLTPAAQTIDPAYSPDGSRIVFSSAALESEPLNLYTIKPDGSGFKLLLACPNGCFVPDWGSKP